MNVFARGRTFAAIVTILVGATSLAAQSSSVEPAWLRIIRAETHAQSGEYGRAIQLYREALSLQPGMPEAYLGLGRSFKAVNDLPVAEEYLLFALENASRFSVPATNYTVLYELGELYWTERRFAEYESTLTQIIALADSEPPPPRTLRPDPDIVRTTLIDDGLDRTLVLFRLDEDGATMARGDFAQLLLGLGRYAAAERQSLIATVQRLSTVIEAVIARDPGFSYTTVSGALGQAELYPETRAYLEGEALYRDLYTLGTAAFSRGNRTLARELWQLVASLPRAGEYAPRSRVQLADPRPEPLLVPPQ